MIKNLAIKAIDGTTAALAYASFPFLKALGRADRRFPSARKAMDRIGISVIPHHYEWPSVTPADIRTPLNAIRELPGLDLNADGQLRLVQNFHFRSELAGVPQHVASPLSPAYRNPKFGPGDAEMLHNVIRHFKPGTFVEIGCGQSTLFALRAEAMNALPCRHICVEPFENAWLEKTPAEIMRRKVEDINSRWLVDLLGENDIFFIDSSHVIRPQGDVLYEFLQLLPILKSGVIVHVHDIYTPRDYPNAWVLGDRRLWNEQYLMEAFLSMNREFEVLLAVNWLFHDHRNALGDACPILLADPYHEPGSFWFRRKPSKPS